MSSKSPTKTKKLAELPLLDEVNELIEKERLLLTLKVLEQQKEAQEWKAKYDTLVGKVSDTSLRTGDFRAMEILGTTSVSGTQATIDNKMTALPSTPFPSSSTSAIPPTTEGIQLVLAELAHNWVLDVSWRPIRSQLLNLILSDVFSVRAPTAIKVALFPHCSITDDSGSVISTILSRPSLEAIDLSYNDLGAAALTHIQAGLKIRRRTPQYLLLNGNPGLSSSSIASTLQLLTDATWGISLSLQDLANGHISAVPKKVPPKPTASKEPPVKKHANTGPNPQSIADLYDPSLHPMLAFEFLSLMSATLDPSLGDKSGKGAKKVVKKETPASAASPSIMRTSKITTLTTLALTHAHLSMQSVSKLAQLLPLLSSSLTDLDLSYGYIGLHGAGHIAVALRHKRCSLIRLGIAGNNIGDGGVEVIAQGLAVNNTLTALDLKSNNVGSKGVRSLSRNICSSYKSTLMSIDLRGNPLPHSSIIAAMHELHEWGSFLTLQYGSSLPAAATGPEGRRDTVLPSMQSIPSDGLILHHQPYRRLRSPHPATNIITLYSIDLHVCNTHYSAHPDHPMCLEWNLRPVIKAGCGPSSSPIEWEVRIHTPTQDILVASDVCEPSAFLGSSSTGPAWARLRAVLWSVPVKGSIEVTIKQHNSSTAYSVEASQCVLFTIPPSASMRMGRDCPAWFPVECRAVSSYMTSSSGFTQRPNLPSSDPSIHHTGTWGSTIPSGYAVIRILKLTDHHIHRGQSISMQWEAKLQTCGSAGVSSGIASSDSASVGYEWCVLLGRCQQACSILVASGSCYAEDAALDNESLLIPWTWTRQVAHIDTELPPSQGDSLILLARPHSKFNSLPGVGMGVGSAGSLDQVEVVAKEVSLGMAQNMGAALADTDGTAMYACHNARGLAW